MAPTPGGGLPLIRLGLVASASLGTGLTDAVYVIFLLETLVKVRASRFFAFLPLAVGSAIAIVAAPTFAVLGNTINRRSKIAFTVLYVGAAASIALAFAFSRFTDAQNRTDPVWRKWAGIVLATVYRAATQSSPYVPTVENAARVQGNEAEFQLRSDLATSFLYLQYRIGFIASSLVISMLPNRSLNNVFPILLTTSLIMTAVITIAMIAMPREEESLQDDMEHSSPPPFRAMVKEHLDAGVLKADKRLISTYMETLFYGLAFGQLGSVTASFFNSDVFKSIPGNPDGIRWAAYTMLIAQGINLILDALLPILVFRENAGKFTMPVAWVGGALFGGVIFAILKFVTFQGTAIALFSALSITTSTHGLFSALSTGAYVEPKYRGTSFGARSAFMNIGILIGAIAGGILAQSTKAFEWIMVWSSVATFLSAIAAFLSGLLQAEQVQGITANANVLWKYLFGMG